MGRARADAGRLGRRHHLAGGPRNGGLGGRRGLRRIVGPWIRPDGRLGPCRPRRDRAQPRVAHPLGRQPTAPRTTISDRGRAQGQLLPGQRPQPMGRGPRAFDAIQVAGRLARDRFAGGSALPGRPGRLAGSGLERGLDCPAWRRPGRAVCAPRRRGLDAATRRKHRLPAWHHGRGPLGQALRLPGRGRLAARGGGRVRGRRRNRVLRRGRARPWPPLGHRPGHRVCHLHRRHAEQLGVHGGVRRRSAGLGRHRPLERQLGRISDHRRRDFHGHDVRLRAFRLRLFRLFGGRDGAGVQHGFRGRRPRRAVEHRRRQRWRDLHPGHHGFGGFPHHRRGV